MVLCDDRHGNAGVKYIKFQSILNQQNHTLDQCQIKLGSMETVSDIVLHIV